MHRGTPGTWEILSIPSKGVAWGGHYKEIPVRGCGAGIRGRDERAGTGRYCQAKATKRDGKIGRKSEQLIRAMRTGNQSEGTRRSKGAAGSWNHWRERCQGNQALQTS